MGKSRLEAFSDGVLAIILTIMVLEMKAPHGAPSLNAIAIATACVAPQIAGALYAIVAVTWLLPDRRIERVLVPENDKPPAA